MCKETSSHILQSDLGAEEQKKKFESMFRMHYRELYGYVFRHLKDRETSRDIVQLVFLNMLELKDLLDDIDNIRSYLYRSVRNELLNYIKHERIKREKMEEIMLRFEEWAGVGNEDPQAERKLKIIRRGINQLPDRCREVFKLSRENGLTYLEIADVLNISVKTVETQMERAFRSLRASVRQNF